MNDPVSPDARLLCKPCAVLRLVNNGWSSNLKYITECMFFHVVVQNDWAKKHWVYLFIYLFIYNGNPTPSTKKQKRTKSSATAKIARVGDHYAVQGHSRSPILIPIESSCDSLILTYLLSLTVSKLLHIIGEISAFEMGYLSLAYSIGVNL